MTKTERVIVVTGAGLVIVAWLLGRCKNCPKVGAANVPTTANGLPPKTVTSQPINNQFSTCNCPGARTTDKNPGDYSQGGYVRPVVGAALPPVGAVRFGAPSVPISFGG